MHREDIKNILVDGWQLMVGKLKVEIDKNQFTLLIYK